MLEMVRENIGEETASHWTDLNLLRRLNISQRKVALMLSMSGGGWLIESADVTPVASLISYPANCSKISYIEVKATEQVIHFLPSIKGRSVNRDYSRTGLEIYPVMDGLMVNEDDYTEEVTVWYQRRIPDLHTCGISDYADAGGATSLTLTSALNPVREVDYYNDAEIEIVSGTGSTLRTSITDYTAAGVCTIATGTFSTDTVYGTISMIPEEMHPYIVWDATVSALMRPGATMDEKVISYYMQEARDAKQIVEEWIESRNVGADGVMFGDLIL